MAESGLPVTSDSLSGKSVVRLMRAHKKTIHGLATAMGITQKRVRHVRANGITGAGFVRDWLESISAA